MSVSILSQLHLLVYVGLEYSKVTDGVRTGSKIMVRVLKPNRSAAAQHNLS